MHTLNRILTALLSLIVLLPAGTFALVSLDQRDQAQQSLQNAIQDAVHTYSERGAAQSALVKGQNLQQQGQAQIVTLEQQKHDLRQKIVVQRGIIEYVSKHYSVTLTGSGQVATLINTETQRLLRLVRAQYLRQPVASMDTPREIVVQSVLHAAAGSPVLLDTTDIQTAQMRFVADLVDAKHALTVLPALEKQRDDVLAAYLVAERQIADGTEMVQKNGSALTDIQGITADVHDQVLQMQSDLARIDAELKSKAERALIAKGLLDPSTITSGHTVAAAPVFHWPAYGHVSAGFMDADYKKHFGVPHLGEDIVVPQGSPVYAAADGVVFLVRDGGVTGYSYILIGHRDGYATLYGHVSQALVTAGQEVTAGDQIALSGGTPGMHGSGPMTTAAHLHFEVIQAGVNIDPATVLP